MRDRERNSRLPALLIALAFTLMALAGGLYGIDPLKPMHLITGLGLPLLRLLFFIAAGLAVGQIIETAGWTRYLAVIAAPLFRFGNLGQRCSATFTTAFFSGAAANAMLYEYWQDDLITRRQLFMTNLANQLPAFFLHLPTTVFMVLPLTGLAGALYFGLTFIAAVLRTFLLMIYGHFIPAHRTADDRQPASEDRDTRRAAAKNIWLLLKRKLPNRLFNIAVYVVPIYTMVFIINAAGLFDMTRQWLTRYVAVTFIPMEALSLVVLSFAAEFTSGFAAAGALMDAGLLTTSQTVVALIAGNVIAFPIRALRHQLPRLLGIFTPRMGMQLLLLGQGYRIVSLIVVTALYWFIT